MSSTQTVDRLPDLPGLVTGIVAVSPGRRGNVYTLQCANCLALETPEHLVLMKTHFHARSAANNNPRLCTPCRVKAYPECVCDSCREDRETIKKGV